MSETIDFLRFPSEAALPAAVARSDRPKRLLDFNSLSGPQLGGIGLAWLAFCYFLLKLGYIWLAASATH